MLGWVNGAPPCKGGSKSRIGAPITLEPGPDSHLLCYSIPDRASHITFGGLAQVLRSHPRGYDERVSRVDAHGVTKKASGLCERLAG
jgi:hypothetical protein